MKKYVIHANDAGQRLDKFLSKAVPTLPASLMHKYIRIKRIKLNGKRAENSTFLQLSDVLELYINDEFFAPPPSEQLYADIAPDLNILYEDENLLLVDKPAGMSVHEDEHEQKHTLVNHIKAYLEQKGEWNPKHEHSFAPALCNRIDRNTGGIVIAAKTAEALRILNEKIKRREIDKGYLCLVHGIPCPKEGKLTGYLKRDLNANTVSVHDHPTKGAQKAETLYRVRESRQDISLVECSLITGRTHQIRAQMAHFGHPLAGDTKYGTSARNRGLPFSWQALYSYRLAFRFTTDAGVLNYLNGQEFTVKQIPFTEYFYSLAKD